MLIDYMGWFKQYKLQDVRFSQSARFSTRRLPNRTDTRPRTQAKKPSAKQQWECTKYVLKTHFSVELPQVRGLVTNSEQNNNEETRLLTPVKPQIYLFHPLAVMVGMKTWEVPFPSFWTQMLPQVRPSTLSFPPSAKVSLITPCTHRSRCSSSSKTSGTTLCTSSCTTGTHFSSFYPTRRPLARSRFADFGRFVSTCAARCTSTFTRCTTPTARRSVSLPSTPTRSR